MLQPFISVFMAVRNEMPFLQECIHAFLAQSYPEDRYEIVIADKSEDGSHEFLLDMEKQYPGRISVLDNPTGKTPHGLNLALFASRGEILALYIGHAVPEKDYLEQIVRSMTENNADMVGGRAIPIPADKSKTAQAIALAMKSTFMVGRNSYTSTRKRKVAYTHWMAVKREFVTRVGGFSTAIPRGEDLDWYMRLANAGARGLYDPLVVSRYYCRPSLSKLASVTFRNGRDRTRWFFKRGDGMQFRHAIPLLYPLALGIWSGLRRSWHPLIGGTVIYILICILSVIKLLRDEPGYLFGRIMLITVLFHSMHVLGSLYGAVLSFGDNQQEDLLEGGEL